MAGNLFPKNMHTVDRALRVLAGIGLLSLTVVGPRTPWGYLGIIPILTGLVGTCPMYTLFGFSTCKGAPAR
ncbi:MAG TPA: DUF2892 domain-containing protein [Gemmatimonadales bacterium]|jgi:hypothetical protein|nr:DUF2892 domain-containing protein [Gemmatimonadales bacterium]